MLSRTDQPSFLTGTHTPKSNRLPLPMHPANGITKFNAEAKFLSDVGPCVAWKSFLRVYQKLGKLTKT
jgi:hypothetical protein